MKSAERKQQGWTQLTEYGKVYLSKKEKNVFILEGTKAAGFSACRFGGSPEEEVRISSGTFNLTVELKCVPSDQCLDKQVFILIDCVSISHLSCGCDFCGVHACFDTHELRIESHRQNAPAQTLFAQPNCSLLRPHSYVTFTCSLCEDTFGLSLNGVSLISNLPTCRGRSGEHSVGIAVYGRTRCCVRRYRITPGVQSKCSTEAPVPGPTAGPAPVRIRHSANADATMPVAEPSLADFVGEERGLMAMIQRDIVVTDLNVSFDDIGGLDDAKRALNEAVVLPFLIPEFFTGIREPWKGILLFGPPGTGKTMLAKAVASCSENLTFFNCSSATLTSKYRGESEKLLRSLFAAARARVPAVLFFDEVDSLLSQRGSGGEHEASRRFKSEFLIHMDGLVSDSLDSGSGQTGHLLVLATTNAPWDLDEALRRRLEKRIFVPMPDELTRKRMFQHHLKDIHLGPDIDLTRLAAWTEHYSGADIQVTCRDASFNPVRRIVSGLSPAEVVQLRDEGKLTPGALPTEMADFEAAIKCTQPSVSIADVQRYSDWAQQFGSK